MRVLVLKGALGREDAAGNRTCRRPCREHCATLCRGQLWIRGDSSCARVGFRSPRLGVVLAVLVTEVPCEGSVFEGDVWRCRRCKANWRCPTGASFAKR